ncbi:MAG: nickel pincer cofactor biosynthesis protein LarC [Vicinamibacterales bacterium]
MASILYLDCFSGASGDMLLGALLDLGVPLDGLRSALGSLRLRGVDVAAERVLRAGVSATKFHVIQDGQRLDEPADAALGSRPNVRESGGQHDETLLHAHGRPHSPEAPAHGHAHAHDHAHGHDHPHDHRGTHPRGHVHNGGADHARPGHSHRSVSDIEALIALSALSADSKARASAMVRRLAGVEAEIHQMPLERVHLHEVGAVDSIVDIVGAVYALDTLGVDEIVASPLNTGSGTVRCAHGAFPVPAPATARLLRGVPVFAEGPAVELLTPTGALVVTAYAARFGPLPRMTIDRIGYGAGSRDFPERPNVLRAMLGSTADAHVGHGDVVVMEFEVDDMNPQLFGPLMEGLYEDGALEVFYAPVFMKKNRPGVLVTVVSEPARRERLAARVFRETTTIGLRYQDARRDCLERRLVSVTTPVGPIRVKVASRAGATLNVAPEFDDCIGAARAHGLATKDVHALALRAYFDRPTAD